MLLVGVGYHRASVVREVALVAGLYAVIVVDFILIVELYLGAVALVQTILELVRTHYGCVAAKELFCCLAVGGTALLLPQVMSHREIKEMGVAPTVCVAKFHVVHCGLALLCGGAGHTLCGVGIQVILYRAADGRNLVVVSATAEHTHDIGINLILCGEAPC